MKKFVVLKTYYRGKDFQGIEIRVEQSKPQKIKKEDCAYYFENAECVNATLVNSNGSIYVRAKRGSIPRKNLSEQREVISFEACEGVVSNIEINRVELLPEFELDAETQRYIHLIIKDRINRWRTSKDASRCHSLALSGVRRIGKTTVLKQLYNSMPNSLFIDGSEFKGKMRNLLMYVQQHGIKYIFVDEVSRLDATARAALISLIKNGTKGIFFILTGSVAFLVERIADSILDCECLDIPPIMYIERLTWDMGIELEKITAVLKYTTHEKFVHWLEYGDIVENRVDYIRGVVEDTLTSYSGDNLTTIKSVFSEKRMRKRETIEKLLYYVASCQLLYILESKNRRYPDLPLMNTNSLSIDLAQKIDALREELNTLKAGFKTEEITAFCDVLDTARLVHKLSWYTKKDAKELEKLIDFYQVPAYVFEYPQIIGDYFGYNMGEMLLDNWIEYAILIKVLYTCFYVGKYRAEDGRNEIDILYGVSLGNMRDKIGIEVKNRKSSSVNVADYIFPELKGMVELIISCNDIKFEDLSSTVNFPTGSEYRFVGKMRNDIIVALLELGLIEQQLKKNKDKSLILSDLYKRYSGKEGNNV